jgi:hypothetical protein
MSAELQIIVACICILHGHLFLEEEEKNSTGGRNSLIPVSILGEVVLGAHLAFAIEGSENVANNFTRN